MIILYNIYKFNTSSIYTKILNNNLPLPLYIICIFISGTS